MNENEDVMNGATNAEKDILVQNDAPVVSEEQACADSNEEKTVISESAEPSLEDEKTEKEDTAVYAFKWEYYEQIKRDKEEKMLARSDRRAKKRNARGAFTYAAVMAVAFLLAFAVLAVSIILDNGEKWFENSSEELTVTEIVDKGMPSSVLILAYKSENIGSTGSGFVINDYGYVVTNYHVVDDAISVAITDMNGKQHSADVVGYDEKIDIALLYSDSLDMPSAALADSDAASLGEKVVAIGSPVGSGSSLSVSDGIISGFDRPVTSSSVGMIQTNAPLNPGNSGGPLFDSYGNVVGVVTAKLSYDTSSDGEKIPLDGIAYAIPINAVKEKLISWINEDLKKPMLGISAVSVEEGVSYIYFGGEGIIYEYVKELGVEYRVNVYGEKKEITAEELFDPNNIRIDAGATGIYVLKVTKGLGADGKLRPGDIVTQLSGVKTASVLDARDIFSKYKAGDTMDVEFYRDGKLTRLGMTLKTKGDMLEAERNN